MARVTNAQNTRLTIGDNCWAGGYASQTNTTTAKLGMRQKGVRFSPVAVTTTTIPVDERMATYTAKATTEVIQPPFGAAHWCSTALHRKTREAWGAVSTGGWLWPCPFQASSVPSC